MRSAVCAALLAFVMLAAGCSSSTVLPAVTLPDLTVTISLCEEAVSGATPAADLSGYASNTLSTGSLASGSNTSSSSGSGSGSASSGGSAAPSSPAHSHAWTAVTEQRWVVDQAAWDEPVYEYATVCACGEVRPSLDHLEHHALSGEAYNTGTKRVQTGTVHHDEVGHYETVTVGYSCSCGAVK